MIATCSSHGQPRKAIAKADPASASSRKAIVPVVGGASTSSGAAIAVVMPRAAVICASQRTAIATTSAEIAPAPIRPTNDG